jgi:hypothetical protein
VVLRGTTFLQADSVETGLPRRNARENAACYNFRGFSASKGGIENDTVTEHSGCFVPF